MVERGKVGMMVEDEAELINIIEPFGSKWQHLHGMYSHYEIRNCVNYQLY